MQADGSRPLRILHFGDSRLRQRSRTVRADEADLAPLTARMWSLLLKHDGLGLSAPQLGDLRRVVVLKDVRQRRSNGPLVLLNPELTETSAAMTVYAEGCLSFPGLYLRLARPAQVVVRYVDPSGREQELSDRGVMARAVQHELDHLDGVLYIDHLPAWRRWLLGRRLRRLARGRGAPLR